MTTTQIQHSPAPPAGTGRKLGVGVAGAAVLMGALLTAGILPRLHKKQELTAAAYTVRTEAPNVNFVVPHLVASADLTLPASMQAIEETTINARTSGYLRRRLVDIGSRVKAGQVLAEIESPEVDQQVQQALADAAKSEAGQGQAQADVAKQTAGVSQTRADYLRAQASLRQAQAGLTHAQAHVTQSKAAQSVAEAKLAQSRQDLEGRKASLLQARTALELADKTSTRYQSLLKQGFVAQQDADEKQAAVDTSKSAITAAQAAIAAGEADVEAAKQTISSAKADVEASQSDVEASRQNIGAFQAALGSAQATIDAANANVQASRANVQAANATFRSSQANTQRYTVLRGFEKITAPFSGIITSRNVDTGALINAGTGSADTGGATTPHSGLFGIARTDVLRIQVSVPQAYLASIKAGQSADILVREFPGRVFKGTVFQSAGALDAATRTQLTEVRLSNTNNVLLPGMYADVRFPAPGNHVLPRIPANTLVVDAQGTRVVVLGPDDTVHYQTVQLGRDFGKEIEIAQGLTGKERLITDPTDDLKEGMKVQPTAAPVDSGK